MALIQTGLTAAGIRSEFFDAFEQVPTVFGDLSTRIQSTKDKESYAFLGSVPPMREWGTGRVARGMFSEKYDIKNAKYELTLEVDRDEIDDDQTGQIRLRIREMSERAALHKDAEIARLLINGHSAGFHSYDGVPFFSASHASGKSGNQDNDITFDATAPTAPTADELRKALASAIATMLGFVDDQGEPMNNDASGLVMVCPPSMYLPSLEAVNTTLLNSTTNVLQGAARVLSFSRLTTASVFYVLKTNVSVRPFIFQDRAPVEFTAQEQDSEEGFKREKYLYGVRARYAMTYGYWQRSCKVTLT